MMSLPLMLDGALCGILLSTMVAVSFLTASVWALACASLLVVMVLRTLGTHEAVSFKVSFM